MTFSKILIANRGEIALRVIRSARALGYRTVAVYSTADTHALHVAAADEAVCIGPPAVGQSYLNSEAILAAAHTTGADAVHPGYGFLSENHDFARACRNAGITFIGPDPDAIELMGNKRAAKQTVMAAGVPVLPGYEGNDDQSDARFVATAEKIGFPIMVKAAAGGGGRGMRLVADASELAQAIQSARSEALNAFGNGELILEKAVVNGRHVEIQIFGDRHGNVIHLGERDCSVQRRHQKIIEESPSPAVDANLRQAMGQAAVNAGKACNYVGAGTCEFLLAADGQFYFLEMNTRLQVEHPVTEMVTGLDMVEWQLRVARGEPLPLTQDQVRFQGHAIEVRLYAEDPAQGFLPQTGRVLSWRPPTGMDVRIDHSVFDGMVVGAAYDPMIAKLIAHGPTRADAIRKLVAALERTTLLGLNTNQTYLVDVLRHPVFADGQATTAFIGDHMQQATTTAPQAPSPLAWAIAGLLRTLIVGGASSVAADWLGWRSAGPVPATVRLEAGGERRHVEITALGSGNFGRRYRIEVYALAGLFAQGTPQTSEFEVVAHSADQIALIHDGRHVRLAYCADDDTLYLAMDNGNRVVRDITNAPPQAAEGAGSGILKSPIDGAVVAVATEAGAAVAKGDLLLVVEAMKMEHEIKADTDGTVASVRVRKGEQVKVRQLLIEITPAASKGN